jgi:hypothetical protein
MRLGLVGRRTVSKEEPMKPLAAAVTGALISGVAMYTVGARTATVDAFTTPEAIQTEVGQFGPTTQLVSTAPTGGAGIMPVKNVRSTSAPRRTVSRSSQSTSERVYTEDSRPRRTWQKSTMIIGGSAASGAGVGAIVGGGKGAAIGAAIGGGAASIYEATKRR